jgi:predicted house-cleaning noncanonical NTP pyrophosphatase (MazG superfamily)
MRLPTPEEETKGADISKPLKEKLKYRIQEEIRDYKNSHKDWDWVDISEIIERLLSENQYSLPEVEEYHIISE